MKQILVLTTLYILCTGCVPSQDTGRLLPDATTEAGFDRAWTKAVTFVPTPSDDAPNTYSTALMKHEPTQAALHALAKQGQPLPVIVWLHGCSAIGTDAWHIGDRYAARGYIVISLDTSARTGRVGDCERLKSVNDSYLRGRRNEVQYALQQLALAQWAKQSHLYLGGYNEGGHLTASIGSLSFRGRIIIADGCQGPGRQGSTRIPRTQPMLAVISKNDQVVSRKVSRVGKCRTNGHPLSTSTFLDSYSHDITNHPRVQQLMDAFLARTD